MNRPTIITLIASLMVGGLVTACGGSQSPTVPPSPTTVPTTSPTPTPASTPFDTGNPALNDSALQTTIDNACEYDTAIDSMVGCSAASLAALSQAQSHEGLVPWTPPMGFWSLSYAQQSLDVVNGERIARNLPPFHLDLTLAACTLAGAEAQSDPACSNSNYTQMAANWASGSNVIQEDFMMMYDDGLATTANGNVDCTPLVKTGCQGHRDNIIYNGYESNGFYATCVDLGQTLSPDTSVTYLPDLSCAEAFD